MLNPSYACTKFSEYLRSQSNPFTWFALPHGQRVKISASRDGSTGSNPVMGAPSWSSSYATDVNKTKKAFYWADNSISLEITFALIFYNWLFKNQLVSLISLLRCKILMLQKSVFQHASSNQIHICSEWHNANNQSIGDCYEIPFRRGQGKTGG